MTATKLRWWPFQLLNFFIARRSLWAAEHILRQRGAPLQLKRLNFIHEARWVALGRFPTAGLRWRERERFWTRWVLFCSNFNQGWNAYLDAFLDSFGSGINSLWGESEGFPPFPSPGTRYAALDYIAERLPATQHYYVAFPEASTNDIRAALRTDRELRALSRPDHEPPDGATREQILRSLQTCIFDMDRRPGTRPPTDRSVESRNGVVGLICSFPVKASQAADLAKALAAMPSPSPLRLIGGVHFARLFVIDRSSVAAGGHPPLRNSWLVFAVVFDAKVAELQASGQRGDRWIDRVLRRDIEQPTIPRVIVGDLAKRMADNLPADFVRDVWGRCRGPAEQVAEKGETRHFAEMLWTGKAKNLMSYRDYPDATVATIADALFERRRLAARLAAYPTDPGTALGWYLGDRRAEAANVRPQIDPAARGE